MKVVAVTGGLGFIGREVVAQLLRRGDRVYVVDAETYAADLGLIDQWHWHIDNGLLCYKCADIVELDRLPEVDVVVHLAAETHVDNSIRDSRRFVRTNMLGTQNLLELCRGKELPPLFVQISTDEVYGDVLEGMVDESAPLRPSNPYAASKAGADHLVQAYARTYGLQSCIVRPSNCYGPHQYPEKLIPKAVRNLGQGRPMPLHNGGTAVRSWLAVTDCASAILTVLDVRTAGIYNVEGDTEASVLDVLRAVADRLGVQSYPVVGQERPGMDTRYHVRGEALRALGWAPQGSLWRDLGALVEGERARIRW